MRTLLLILLILFTIVSKSQPKISGQIIDSLTQKPLSGFTYQILENNDMHFSIGKTDQLGHFSFDFEYKYFDKTSTYQIYIKDSKYNIVKITVDPLKPQEAKIYLSKNDAYFPKFKGMVYKDCTLFGFGEYEYKSPRYLSDFPDSIRLIVTNHLRERVGNSFYSKLQLSGGQIIDLDRLQILMAGKIYTWIPGSYYLCFSFCDTSLGIARYTTRIILNKTGKIVEETGLPDIKSDSSKGKIISLSKAMDISKSHGYVNDDIRVEFDYDKSEDSFVWIIRKIKLIPEYKVETKTIIISANKGTVVNDRTEITDQVGY